MFVDDEASVFQILPDGQMAIRIKSIVSLLVVMNGIYAAKKATCVHERDHLDGCLSFIKAGFFSHGWTTIPNPSAVHVKSITFGADNEIYISTDKLDVWRFM